jgi:hypothetical protein
MAEREPFCCNEQCEFHEPKMRRNEGDRLRLSDGSEVLRHYISGRFFCACCARAVELAYGVGEVGNG